MSNLTECVNGRIDELNGKFKDIILSSREMFAGIPFVLLEHNGFRNKATVIVKDIEFKRGYSIDFDTFLKSFNDAARSVSRCIQRGIVTGSGIAPEANSLRSISIDNRLDIPMPHGYGLLSSINHLVEKSTVIAERTDFVVMSERTLRKCGFSVPTGSVLRVQGAEVFINPYAEDSVYAGKWARDGKDGMAIIYPKNSLTCVELIKPGSEEPVVRLKTYLNLAMFGENNIFRMDGF